LSAAREVRRFIGAYFTVNFVVATLVMDPDAAAKLRRDPTKYFAILPIETKSLRAPGKRRS
jgi:hypothetical protein